MLLFFCVCKKWIPPPPLQNIKPGLVSSVGRRWVPYAGMAWVRILVVLDSETNLSDLPVPVHSLVGLTLLPTPNPRRSQSQVFHMRAGYLLS